MFDWLVDPLAEGTVRRALLELLLLGAACGPLGVWVLLFRQSYAAESIAHAMLPGLVLAALAGAPLVLGAGAGLGLAAALIALALRDRRVGADLGVAVAVSALFGSGVLLALAPDVPPRLGELLFGDLLGLTRGDLAIAAGLVAVVLAGLGVAHRGLVLVGFDRPGASALGTGPGRIDLVLLALLAVTVLAVVQAVGALLAVALVLAPGSAALRLARRTPTALALAAGLAILAGLAGLLVSFHLELAAGASVALCAVALFAATLLPVTRRPAGARGPQLPVEAMSGR